MHIISTGMYENPHGKLQVNQFTLGFSLLHHKGSTAVSVSIFHK